MQSSAEFENGKMMVAKSSAVVFRRKIGKFIDDSTTVKASLSKMTKFYFLRWLTACKVKVICVRKVFRTT